MKILATADFHGSIEASEKAAAKAENIKADVVLACGDITHFGTPEDARKVLMPLIEQKLPILYVPGNCDPPSLLDEKIEGTLMMHGKCEVFDNYSYVGAGSIPLDRVHPSPLEVDDEEIWAALSKGLKQCDSEHPLIVVSHSPPAYTRLDKAFFGGHVGSPLLRQFIEKYAPMIVFCGHIHEAKGVDHIGKTVIVNTGPARHGNCVVANLDGKVEVQPCNL
jgi:Icc-related predicted phosphoesterase